MLLNHKFEPFFRLLTTEKTPVRYVVLIGGRGGAKSHALCTWLNHASFIKGWGFLFTRWTMVSAEKSVIPEFEKICSDLGNDNAFEFQRTQVINKATKNIIDYSGLKPASNSSTGALKSLSSKNIFILEEAEDCPNYEQFDKVDNSIRTISHPNIVILCLNQGHISHWIYKEFIAEKRTDTLVIETTYLDNLKFLDDSFINKAERVKARNLKRYNHIYLNEWKTDVDGALWLDRDITPYRITLEDFLKLTIKRAVIGYDPAVTDTDKPQIDRIASTGNDPDEDGIIICCQCTDKHFYVIGDKSRRGTRSHIAQLLSNLYHSESLDLIVVEKNNGGDFIPALIKSTDNGKYVRTKTVSATKGKIIRAQPIQARYELGEVHHVGHFPELELEMTTYVPDIGLPSPNRMDALVWGFTELMNTGGHFTLT